MTQAELGVWLLANVDRLPLEPPADFSAGKPPPTPAPAIVALLSAWAGLVTLVAAIVLPFLPGSRRPRVEMEGHAWSFADRWIPFPIYASVVALFLGIVVLWQMRRHPRPLPQAMLGQRTQAWVGIVLALTAIVFIYAWVAIRVAWRSGQQAV